jgi:non-heme chloroperoxidase
MTRRGPYVEVERGVSLYVQQFGAGPEVVFVHGGAVTHAFWDQQVGALMDSYRTIAYDLRGCGRSDRPASGYSIDVWAEDLHALIASLGLERPTVVGHALGTHVALRLAATHPDAVGRLVLAAAAPWFSGERDGAGGFPDDLLRRLRDGWLNDRAQAELDLVDEKYFHRPPSEGLRMWCLQMALEWPLPVFLQLVETLPDVDHREALPHVDVPVLLAHGLHDRKNRYEGAAYLASSLPDARLVTFEDSAHCPPVEEPARFNETLAEFLREPAASSSPAPAA